MKWTSFLALLLLPYTSYTQLIDDFSNGLSNEWLGDSDHFIINQYEQLQLSTTGIGNSELLHGLSFPDSIEWQFDIKLNFSPSNNNKLRIVLASTHLDPYIGISYVLDIGETGNQDAIEFLKIKNGNEEILASGIPGKVSKAFYYRYLITKNNEGLWRFFSQDIDGSNKQLEFAIQLSSQQSEFTLMNFFGLFCRYTSSNADDFYFDNIKISEIQRDSFPPRLLSVKAIEEDKILILFDEPIIESTAINPLNYVIQPSRIILDANYVSINNSVCLQLSNPLDGCSSYQISISGLQDTLLNKIIDSITTFNFYEGLKPGDILINELLSDPQQDGSDYLELINPTSKSYRLKGLIIRNEDKNEEAVINDDWIIHPDQIIVLTSDSINIIENYHPPIGTIFYSLDLPSFNNSSGNVSLLIEDSFSIRRTIDIFDYNQSQHNYSISSSDGISLERIDISRPAQDFANWSSSENEYFGTPGFNNSIQNNSSIGAKIINPFEIEILFTDQMLLSSIISPTNYKLSDTEIIEISINDENQKNIFLFLEKELSSGTIYQLEIQNLKNSCQDTLADIKFELALIENPLQGDILINELLFNPYVGHYDFLELINNSNKFINLSQLNVYNAQNSSDENIHFNDYLGPGEIIAITKDIDLLTDKYVVPDSANIIEDQLPAFNNDIGNVTLRIPRDDDWLAIDSFDYSESMHYQLLNNNEGVSLERINLANPTNDRNNWFSSSQDYNFATPGFKNSAFTMIPEIKEDVISLPYQVFSPDGDGYKDFLLINYNLGKPGFLANITIYDDSGYQKLRLSNNHLMGNKGIIKWAGLDNRNLPLPIGMYIIYYSLFHPDGDIFEGKKVCVLAQDLNN